MFTKIYKFKKSMYKYGLSFYNPETKHELKFYFYAFSAFNAYSNTSHLQIDGYIKGEVNYIEGNDIDYNNNLFDYFNLDE